MLRKASAFQRPRPRIACCRQGPESPAASARIQPVLRRSSPSSPSRNRPADAATRSCVNKGRIRAFTSRSDAAQSSSVSSIDAPLIHPLPTTREKVRASYQNRNCSASLAITTALTLRTVFRLALRQTEGLIGSILQLLDLDLPVPDHSTLSRRAETLAVPRPKAGSAPMHLLVDSTGLKLYGPGEWLAEKHGTKRRRAWRVLHLATDADTGRIVASVLTDKDADDGSQVGPLLDRIEGAVASFTGDGAYDRDDVYAEVAVRHPAAAVVVPPRANAVPSDAAEIAPTQRDRHLRCIAERGRMGWQRASGY